MLSRQPASAVHDSHQHMESHYQLQPRSNVHVLSRIIIMPRSSAAGEAGNYTQVELGQHARNGSDAELPVMQVPFVQCCRQPYNKLSPSEIIWISGIGLFARVEEAQLTATQEAKTTNSVTSSP